MSSELEQTLAYILQRMSSSTNQERHENFQEWWNSIDDEEQEVCLEILRERASIVFPDRENASLEECLPWKLEPREDELSTMLDTWYPKNMSGKSFVRECLRWKVSVTNSPIQGQIMRGARKAQIHKFTEMMIKRHPEQYTGEAPNPQEELEKMIQEGHFEQLELGLVTPNLFQVRVSEDQAILYRGWPLKLLKLDDNVNTEAGIYVIQISEDYPIVEFEDYIAGLDPIKSMVNSASQYIETLIQIAESNDSGSEYPQWNNLIMPNFVNSPFIEAIGEKNAISIATWKFGDVHFLVERESWGEDGRNPARIWINSDNPKFNNLKVGGWKTAVLRFGAVKKLQIAYRKCQNKTMSISDCRSRGLVTAEIVRFNTVNTSFPGEINNQVKDKFLEMNWLKGD